MEIVTFFSESLSVICTGRARVWRDEQIYVGRQVLMMCIYLRWEEMPCRIQNGRNYGNFHFNILLRTAGRRQQKKASMGKKCVTLDAFSGNEVN